MPALPPNIKSPAVATTVAIMSSLFLSAAATADPATPPGWREIWSGADVSGHVWLLYSGATVAPYSNIFDDGLRLRVAGGYGGYTYAGERRSQLVSFKPPSPRPSSAI
jgi:hypothetical protein